MFAGIDYLTLWCDSSLAANTSFYSQATDWLVSNADTSHKIKPATLYGTKGIRIDGSYAGIGDTRAMINIPSSLAQLAYCELYNPSHKVTRIDVQVTTSLGYSKDNPKEALWGYEFLLAHNEHKGKGRQPKPTYSGGRDSGLTIYSGSADSSIFGRIYDKAAQSENPAYKNMYRWEFVARREWAEVLASRFLMLTYDEITSDCVGLAGDFWLKRGIKCPWEYTNKKLFRQPPKEPFDYERSLRWLEATVAPTIERLRGFVSLPQILIALGLEHDPILEYTTSSGNEP